MRRVFIICCSLIFLLSCLSGCSSSITNTKIEVKFSEFTGVRNKEIQLNDSVTSLTLKGTISLSSGSVELSILGKDTNEILYSDIYTKDNSGEITVCVSDLHGNTNLVFMLDAYEAKTFYLNLTSDQKLVRDKEKPSR